MGESLNLRFTWSGYGPRGWPDLSLGWASVAQHRAGSPARQGGERHQEHQEHQEVSAALSRSGLGYLRLPLQQDPWFLIILLDASDLSEVPFFVISGLTNRRSVKRNGIAGDVRERSALRATSTRDPAHRDPSISSHAAGQSWGSRSVTWRRPSRTSCPMKPFWSTARFVAP